MKTSTKIIYGLCYTLMTAVLFWLCWQDHNQYLYKMDQAIIRLDEQAKAAGLTPEQIGAIRNFLEFQQTEVLLLVSNTTTIFFIVAIFMMMFLFTVGRKQNQE